MALFAFDEEHLRFASADSSHPPLTGTPPRRDGDSPTAPASNAAQLPRPQRAQPSSSTSPQPLMDDTEVVVSIQEFVARDVPRENTASRARRVGPEDFETIKIVGKGAYGKVFLVRKKNTGGIFAMKVLQKAEIVLHHKDAEHTRAERQILEEIRHPFIVKLYYAFQTNCKLYLILDFAPGGELFTHLEKERMFTEPVARFYVSELFLAIEHLHEMGIIYRDLKPENILLDASGHVVLTDFGLSKVALDAATVCGTAEYMAPEVVKEESYSQSVDYWSLGILLCDMLLGKTPFEANNRKKVMDNIVKKKPTFPKYISPYAKDLITRLLKKNPQQRLGAKGPKEFREHKFFKTVDWVVLEARQVTPPIIPVVKSSCDTSNFRASFTALPTDESPTPDSLLRPSDADLFKGFSYVDESLAESIAQLSTADTN